MTILYAQPYIDAEGFYFRSIEDYNNHASVVKTSWGDPIEEFEIQFIDGQPIDAELFKTLSIHQGNIKEYFDACEDWDDDQKANVIIAVGDVGYVFDIEKDSPDNFDIEIYEVDSMRELSVQFVEEGLFGDIPEHLQFYIDYDAIARDLAMDYSEITIAGRSVIYRCD